MQLRNPFWRPSKGPQISKLDQCTEADINDMLFKHQSSKYHYFLPMIPCTMMVHIYCLARVAHMLTLCPSKYWLVLSNVAGDSSPINFKLHVNLIYCGLLLTSGARNLLTYIYLETISDVTAFMNLMVGRMSRETSIFLSERVRGSGSNLPKYTEIFLHSLESKNLVRILG